MLLFHKHAHTYHLLVVCILYFFQHDDMIILYLFQASELHKSFKMYKIYD